MKYSSLALTGFLGSFVVEILFQIEIKNQYFDLVSSENTEGKRVSLQVKRYMLLGHKSPCLIFLFLLCEFPPCGCADVSLPLCLVPKKKRKNRKEQKISPQFW